MKPKVMACALLLLPVAVSGTQLSPQPNDVRMLMSVRSLRCSFPKFASADWGSSGPQTKTGSQDFGFQIDGIDHAKQSARMIGNAGATDLLALDGDETITFVEQTPVGTVNVTSVFGWKDGARTFKAVHSRHTAIGGPSPSQNYGSCEIWD